MTNLTATNTAGADWSSLRLLHKLYVTLAQEFSIEYSPCAELETANAGSPKSVAAAEAWFARLDERIAVHQLRQFLQTSPWRMRRVCARRWLTCCTSRNTATRTAIKRIFC